MYGLINIHMLIIGEIFIRILQVNLDMTESMGPGKLVRHMQNPSYTYDKYLICSGLGPSILSVICKNSSYSGPSYQSSPVPITLLQIVWWYFSVRTQNVPEVSGQNM